MARKDIGSELLDDIHKCGIDHVLKASRDDLERAVESGDVSLVEIKNAQQMHEKDKPIAYRNFVKITGGFFERLEKIRDSGITCGDCAAFPCFRTPCGSYANEPAGGCYQEERQCRQECRDYNRIEGSGAFPDFKIKGTCGRSNKIVDYCAPCEYSKDDMRREHFRKF